MLKYLTLRMWGRKRNTSKETKTLAVAEERFSVIVFKIVVRYSFISLSVKVMLVYDANGKMSRSLQQKNNE